MEGLGGRKVTRRRLGLVVGGNVLRFGEEGVVSLGCLWIR